jgi:hypothetical protein
VDEGDDMTTDDDRIGYLSGDDTAGELDHAERAELDDVRALLADPAVWAEPPSGLEDAVVAAVAHEAAAPSAPGRSPAQPRHRRGLRTAALVGVVAAAAALVVAVVLGPGRDAARPELDASLQATDLVPGASGYATFTETDSGWRIELDATGLPRLDDGSFYQAWLRNAAGVLIPVGTFNEPDDVVLWAGVSPVDFATITVTQELADDDPTSSGRRVLVGSIVER